MTVIITAIVWRKAKSWGSQRSLIRIVVSCWTESVVWGQALKVLGGSGSQISRLSSRVGGKVSSPTHRPHLSLVFIPARGWVEPKAIVLLEGLCKLKFSMTRSGIEPATFQIIVKYLNQLSHKISVTQPGIDAATFQRVAQCLNLLRHRVPYCMR